MSGKINELVKDNKLYNTKIEEDRYYIGQYNKSKLLEYFQG